MSINSSNTLELSIDKIVRLALNTAGVLPVGAAQSGAQWNNLANQARDFLELITDHLPAKVRLERIVGFYDITMVSGQAEYELPSSTLAVVGDAMYLGEGETDGQSKVIRKSRDFYFNITDKTASGRPTVMYTQMHETVSLFLWPVPDDNGTLTIQRQSMLADCNDGTKKPDLERFWNEYLYFELAHKIALGNTVSISRCAYLKKQADNALLECKKLSAQPGPIEVVNSHTSQWGE